MIRIVTDSISDLTLEEAAELGVEIVPLTVSFGEESYIDMVSIDRKEFYEKLAVSKELPVTGMPSPKQFINVYKKYPDEDIIGIFVAARSSGTLQSATLAKNETGRDNIYIVDSDSMTGGLNLLVREACKYRDAGDDAGAIVAKIEAIKVRVEVLAVMDTLEYLIKGGRLSATGGAIANILSIKPLAGIKDGKVISAGKARGVKAGIRMIVKNVKENRDENLPIMAIYSYDTRNLELLMEELGEDCSYCSVGSVVGTHAGPNAVGLAFFRKPDDGQ